MLALTDTTEKIPAFDGRQLRARREALSMTLMELGDFLRMSWRTIGKWERNDTHPEGASLSLIHVFLADPVAIGRALGTLYMLQGKTVEFPLDVPAPTVLPHDPIIRAQAWGAGTVKVPLKHVRLNPCSGKGDVRLKSA